MGIMFSFLSALSFAFSNIFIKKGIDYSRSKINGFFITIIINFLLLSLFLGVYIVVKKTAIQFSWYGILFFILSGLLTTGLGRSTFYSSINLINPSRASGLKNAAPLFTVLFALFILGERLNFKISIGIIILLSALLLQGAFFFLKTKNKSENKNLKNYDKKELLGYLLAISAAILYGTGQGTRKQGLLLMNEPYLGAWIGALTVFIFIIVRLVIKKELKRTTKKNWRNLNKYFIIAGVLTAIGPLSFFFASSIIPVAIVSVIVAIEPVLTIIFSVLFLKGKEKLTTSVWIIGILVLIGSIIIIEGI